MNIQIQMDQNGNTVDLVSKQKLSLVPLFPNQDKSGPISVVDTEGEEITVLFNWCERSDSDVIRTSLAKMLKIPMIQTFSEVRDEFELRRFVVNTDCGQRVFYTMCDSYPIRGSKGEFHIQDITGDHFRFQLEGLSEKCLRKIAPLVH